MQGGTWQSGEVTFEDLEGFNQHTQFRLIIEAGVNNAAVGLDEIEVIQLLRTASRESLSRYR